MNWEEVLEKSFPKRDLVCKFCRENSDKVEHMTGIFSPENTFLAHHAVVNLEKAEFTYEEICSFFSV